MVSESKKIKGDEINKWIDAKYLRSGSTSFPKYPLVIVGGKKDEVYF